MHNASPMRTTTRDSGFFHALRWATRSPLHSIVCTLLVAACAPQAEDESVIEPDRWATGMEVDEDLSGDLRPEARALIEERQNGEVEPEVIAAGWQPPTTIRVWRRGLDGSSASCSGRVDVIPFESYVKGVLPHEWIRSWHVESLKSGAIAIRTYAANWIRNGGKYTCADLDDTTASQVYKDERFANTNAAVDATANMYVMKNGLPINAEYSAENSNPTATGVSDPLCTGKTRYGHGRGECQWGSQRWASQSGKSATWIVEHYYPGATVQKVGGGTTTGSTIVVDSENANNDAAKAKVEYAGTWTQSSATSGFYGSSYRFAATEQTSAPATFSFYLAAPATKSVDAWWTSGSNRSAAASFIAYASDGSEVGRATKNQQTGGGAWINLGTYSFKAGWNRVVLSRWQAPGSVVIADAIRVR